MVYAKGAEKIWCFFKVFKCYESKKNHLNRSRPKDERALRSENLTSEKLKITKIEKIFWLSVF
jgi:hypothetical protein